MSGINKHYVRLALSVVVVLLVYMTAYYGLVSSLPPSVTVRADLNGTSRQYRISGPYYQYGGSISQILFLPAHLLDRRLRPAQWKEWDEWIPRPKTGQ
jgi:hypothetical protein